MSVTSIRIDDKKRKVLKIIASIEGKTMGKIIEELIDEYIKRNKKKLLRVKEKEEIYSLMKLSEDSFSEWDNEVDDIYDKL